MDHNPSPDQPQDDRIKQIIRMDSPEYSASLTDPMAEVDDHFRELKRICKTYGLACFLLISHPASDGTVKHQMVSECHAPATPRQLWSGVDLQVRSLSKQRVGLTLLDEPDLPAPPDQ